MKYRTVLLDRSFLHALRAEHDPDHEGAKALYWGLVDSYVAGTDQLFALSTVLEDLPRNFRTTALAPVLTFHVARQHFNAAATMTDYLPDDALTLVMMQRHKVRAVATTRDAWDTFDIEVLKPRADLEPATEPSNDIDAPTATTAPADGIDNEISSRTGPTPVPRPTAE